MGTEYGFVEIGNAKLYYELTGEGKALVLIHAGMADSRQWNNKFAHLDHPDQFQRVVGWFLEEIAR